MSFFSWNLCLFILFQLLVPVKKDKFPQLTAYLERAITWPYYEEIQVDGMNKLKQFFKEKLFASENF